MMAGRRRALELVVLGSSWNLEGMMTMIQIPHYLYEEDFRV